MARSFWKQIGSNIVVRLIVALIFWSRSAGVGAGDPCLPSLPVNQTLKRIPVPSKNKGQVESPTEWERSFATLRITFASL